MKPTLLSFPHVSAYPVFLLLGVFLGWALARPLAKRHGIAGRHIDNLALIIPLLGLAGARFFARLFYAKLSLWESLQVWKGDGLVFYGGFLACIGGIWVYSRWQNLSLKRMFDALAPSAAVGLAFGRIGCFFAGCCWGDLCVPPQTLAGLSPEKVAQVQTIPRLSGAEAPFALQFPPRSDVYKTQVKWGLLQGNESASLPVHPVQLYEAVLALGLAITLWLGSAGVAQRAGMLSLGLVVGYATIRFVTEFFRGDNRIGGDGFTISQTISIYLALGAMIVWLLERVFGRKSSPSPLVQATDPTPVPAA